MDTTPGTNARTHATRSDNLRWEGTAWAVVGAAWTVSAWPGILVEFDHPAAAACAGVLLAGLFLAWQAVVHGTPWGRVGERVPGHRPGRPRRSRRYVRNTVIADALVIGASGVAWCAAARAYHWPESVTGASLQVAAGVAFLVWAALHVPAARRLRGTVADVPVVSRRILGTGPATVEPVTGEAETLLEKERARARRRRAGRLQRWVLNPPMRLLTCSGALPGHAVLETVGRTTGRRRRTVVGIAPDAGDAVWIIAEHGLRAGYVRNLRADGRVRLHVGGRWRNGRAAVVEGDDVGARMSAFAPGHVAALRRFGTSHVTVRVELSPAA